jgi:hypothetical protein
MSGCPWAGLRRAIEFNEHALTVHALARIRGKEVLASAKMCMAVDRDGTTKEHAAASGRGRLAKQMQPSRSAAGALRRDSLEKFFRDGRLAHP